jgi:hypothetical protein
MAEYRSPKTTDPRTTGGSRKWMWVAAAVIALLVIAWFAGFFGQDTAPTPSAEPTTSSAPTTTPDAPAATTPAAPTAVEPPAATTPAAPTAVEPPAATTPATPGSEPPATEAPTPMSPSPAPGQGNTTNP